MPSTSINVYEAKTQLSKLVDRAPPGGEILIAKAGKPFARLMPLAHRRPPLPELMGQSILGLTYVAPDFDEEDLELTALFENVDSPGDPFGK